MEIVSHDSYNSTPHRGGSELEWTRVYFPYGKLAHFREAGLGCPVVRFRYGDLVDGTFGTGSQEEYDTAGALPLCRHCWHIRELYANHPDPRLGMGHGVEMT